MCQSFWDWQSIMDINFETRDDYIFNSFSKIRHKKQELYTITRIFHQLNDLELEFVCQQKVRKEDGEIYLIDLFFPQLQIYLEVDEAYHLKEENLKCDRLRMQQIWEITSWEGHRIPTHNGINQINLAVENFIELLRARKTKLENAGDFKVWTASPKDKIQMIQSRGFLSVELNDCLPTQADVTRLFGAKHKQWMRGTFPYQRPFAQTNKMIWFPKIYKHNTWTNQLEKGGTVISEMKTACSEIPVSSDQTVTRITFGHYKDPVGGITYRYMGEFDYNVNLSSKTKNIYELTSQKTCLDNFLGEI